MKGIVFTKEMIDARENGATMFIVPIERKKLLESLEYFNNFYSDDKGILKEIYKIAIKNDSPLQKGDEFFIQEPFTCSKKGDNIHYENDFENDNIFDDWCEYANTTNFESAKMQEHQARYKDICLDIQVKMVQDISHNNGEIYKIYPGAHEDGYDNFMHGFNDNFLYGKYEENPYIFLITYKGIQK